MFVIPGFTADKIKGLLETHHKDDIFVCECKNGSTWSSSHLLKLDAWALKRTYSPFTTIGYEVKVSRADFEQDQKWVDYLPYCHLFYFVCPGGLIQSHELPAGVGLIWVSSTGKLHTKRKAEHRKPETDKMLTLMTYVLMSRSVIVADMNEANAKRTELQSVDRIAAKRKIVEDANAKGELAYFVKGHVRQLQEYYEKENRRLKSREDNIERFTRNLARLGIKWDPERNDWQETMRVENEISLLKSQLTQDSLWKMESTAKSMLEVVTIINDFRRKQEKGTEVGSVLNP